MKVTYYCAMSADEFIATKEGDVSWLDEVDIDESESSYESFFTSVDGLVMGRDTYDFVFDYGSWPYGDILTWVVSSKSLEVLEGATISQVSTVDDFVQEAIKENKKHIWLVGGGKLASAFVEKGILTDLSITVMPVELGTGIPLFSDHKLESIESVRNTAIQHKGYKRLEIALGQ